MEEGAVPTRWQRLKRHPLIVLLLQLALVVTPILVMSGVVLRRDVLQTPTQYWTGVAGVCLVSVLLYRLYYRVLAWHENSRLPLRLTSLLMGVGVGMLLFTSVIAVMSLLGVAHLDVAADYEGANQALALAVVSGVTEEIIVRGVVFRNLEAFLGTWIAMALSAALFGWLHASNPHATLASSIAIGLQAGILLAAAYVATRSLWTPIGIHFAWNFMQGGVFGVPISGFEAKGILATTLSGPEWLSGGAFGVEASVVATGLCLVAAVAYIVRAVRLGRIARPRWSRARPAR